MMMMLLMPMPMMMSSADNSENKNKIKSAVASDNKILEYALRMLLLQSSLVL